MNVDVFGGQSAQMRQKRRQAARRSASIVRTSSAVISGSDSACPARGTNDRRDLDQPSWSWNADNGGQIMSYRP